MSTATKKHKKPGRPKLAENERRSKAIMIRITDDEKRQIEKQLGNRNIADWAREKLGLA